MTAILFCGPAQAAAGRDIGRVLAACGGVCRYTGDRLILPEDCRFLFLSGDRQLELRADSGICILAPEQRMPVKWQVPPGFVAVAHSADRTALRLLERQGAPAVACGMSAADTVTLSSIREGGAVVTLQRSLCDLSGRWLEPGDYPVKLAFPISDYGLLAGLAALLLAGVDPTAALKDKWI